MADDDFPEIDAMSLEAVFAQMKPSYGFFRDTPREEDGGWLEMIDPEHPQYAEAEKRFNERMRKAFNGR